MNLLNLLLKTLLTDSSISALAKKTGLSITALRKLVPLARSEEHTSELQSRI